MSKPIVSIDLWGTLIKASPIFKEKKVKLIREYFPEFDEDDIFKAYRKTKEQLDFIIERTGWQPEYRDIWIIFLSHLKENFFSI